MARQNENTDPKFQEAASKVLTELQDWTLSTYPEAGACYRKLANWVDVSPDQLLLTAGSDGAIRATFDALVEPGDSIIHTSPTFAMYPVYAQIFGAKPHVLDYKRGKHKPELGVEEMTKVIEEVRPKLVCLPNPDSPTGTTLRTDQLSAILTACEENNCMLLVDEVTILFRGYDGANYY